MLSIQDRADHRDGQLLLTNDVLQRYNIALYSENILQLNVTLCISLT